MTRSDQTKPVAALIKCGNPNCKHTHANRRFCSRACSVSVTNREVPRRPKKNFCLDCSALIKAGQVYCRKCKDGGNAQLSLELHSTLKFTTLAGGRAEEPLNPISLTARYVFRCQGPGSAALAGAATCGDLIAAMMALCASEPEFLTPAAARRHLTFLNELRHLELGPILGANSKGTVAQAPLKLLNLVLEPWVMSYLETPVRPLYARYALDTARLLVRLINGETGKLPEPWELEPVLKGLDCDLRLRRDLLGFQLRKAVHSARLEVEARVPDGVYVRGRDETCLGPGDRLRLVAGRDAEPGEAKPGDDGDERPLLIDPRALESGETAPADEADQKQLFIDPRPLKPRFDIAPDLVIEGLVKHGDEPEEASLRLELPWGWITAELVEPARGEPQLPVDVPRWTLPSNSTHQDETLPSSSQA